MRALSYILQAGVRLQLQHIDGKVDAMAAPVKGNRPREAFELRLQKKKLK